MFHNFLMQTTAQSLCRNVNTYGQYLSNLCNFFSNQRCFCVHVCKGHHTITIPYTYRDNATSILQLTAKNIHPSVFYTGNRNNH